MKKTMMLFSVVAAFSTLLYAQQRRQFVVCPIDGQQMRWDGNQQGGLRASCEFSHVAIVDGQQATHKAWASCSE